MASQSEQAFAFYSAGSGLTPASNFTLNEHQFAYLKSHGASGAWSLDDAEAAVWNGAGSEYAYLGAQGQTGSLDQRRSGYYGGGGSSGGLGVTPLGTGALGA